VQVYGFPFIVVDSAVPPRAVTFAFADESDGVDHTTGASVPFYTIPDEEITQAHWIESGEPGTVDRRIRHVGVPPVVCRKKRQRAGDCPALRARPRGANDRQAREHEHRQQTAAREPASHYRITRRPVGAPS